MKNKLNSSDEIITLDVKKFMQKIQLNEELYEYLNLKSDTSLNVKSLKDEMVNNKLDAAI